MNFLSISGGLLAVAIIVPVIVLLIAIYAIWYITTKNSFIGLTSDMEESFSAMDVHMKKRYDLIPNLVEVCKGYAKFESDTLTEITRARNIAMTATGSDRMAAESALTSQLHTLLNAVNEKYPDLKANAQFANLANQLEQCEYEIANSRKYYNAKVKILNNKILKFPSSIIANKMNLEKVPYFEIEDARERVAPKVNFDDAPKTRF